VVIKNETCGIEGEQSILLDWEVLAQNKKGNLKRVGGGAWAQRQGETPIRGVRGGLRDIPYQERDILQKKKILSPNMHSEVQTQ